MGRLFLTLAFGSVIAAGLCSCGKDGAAPVAEGDGFEVHKTFGTGPVKLTIELSSTSITTAEAVNGRMTLRLPAGYEAEFPELLFPSDVPGAIPTDQDEREVTEGDDRLVIREFELEPESAGTVTLPKLEVYYHREGETAEERFETDEIEITVTPTPESAEALELKPARGLVTVEQIEAQQRRRWPWVLAGVAAVAGLAVLVVYLIRRPRPVPPPRPAHEVAWSRLRELAARDLIGAGRAEPFFVEVTTIVRDYIEGQFGVRAPEQTTEEFLVNMVTEPAVARFREVLQPFLTAADEVKFARLVPERAAMQRAFDTAENFVSQSSNTGGALR